MRKNLTRRKLLSFVASTLLLAQCSSAESGPVRESTVAATTTTTTRPVAPETLSTTSTASTTSTVAAGVSCTAEGQRSGDLECRLSSRGTEWMSTGLNNPRPDTYGDDQACKLPDRRTNPSSAEVGLVIGFPRSLSGVRTPSTGTATMAAVAVDFPDYRGNAGEIARLRETAESFDAWLAVESVGRLSTTWQFHEQWITMSKPAADYQAQGFGDEPYQELSTEIVDRVLEVMALSELDELFVYFPDSLTNEDQDLDDAQQSVLPQIGLPIREAATFDYSRIRNMKGSGTISKRNGNVLWAIWAHEFLHALGLQVHGPEPTTLIDNMSSHSFAVSAWARWLLGWLDDDQIACIAPSALPTEVDLVPLEENQTTPGIRAAIVPLTETSAILIESHRAIGHSTNRGFGNGLGIGEPGTYGITVWYLDSDETAPYDPFTADDSAGTRFLYADTLLDGTRENYGTLAGSGWPIQPLVLLGETVTYESLAIEFTASTGFDSITISAKP